MDQPNVTQGEQGSALDQALTGAKMQSEDASAVRLARHYAYLLDRAAPASKYAKALEWLADVADGDEGAKHAETIRTALSEHSVASDLGPKLLAALTALGMTPAARGALAGKVNPAPDGAVRSPLDELRAKRAAKASG